MLPVTDAAFTAADDVFKAPAVPPSAAEGAAAPPLKLTAREESPWTEEEDAARARLPLPAAAEAEDAAESFLSLTAGFGFASELRRSMLSDTAGSH